MAEIGETAIKRDAGDRGCLIRRHQHASRMMQPDLLDKRHRRVATARLEEMKDAACACPGRNGERLNGDRLIPMSLDVLLRPANLPRRCPHRLSIEQTT